MFKIKKHTLKTTYKNHGFIRKFIIILIMIPIIQLSYGQQDPGYTQYMFNQQTVNPAYAGSWESIGFMALNRKQWVGFEGSPSTQTFAFQTPLNKENIGLGLSIISDQIGLEKRFSVSTDYSYRIKLNHDISLRFGLKGGFTNYSHNITQYRLDSQNQPDQLFQNDINKKFMPNVGVGAFLHSKKFYVGLSVPKVIKNKHKDNDNFSTYAEIRHFFLTGAYVFNLNESIKFKPTFLTKASIGAPVQFDLSANFLLKEKLWLGAMVRTSDAFGFIAQWIFDKKLRIGYAMDFTTSNLKNYHNGVHEIMVSYELSILKTKVSSPRYF